MEALLDQGKLDVHATGSAALDVAVKEIPRVVVFVESKLSRDFQRVSMGAVLAGTGILLWGLGALVTALSRPQEPSTRARRQVSAEKRS
mmetsp:Transcript_24268/g.71270  ORF Transcript_24268/g.71270 Transcript_24268/m.71270 type:complete len:89 (+) Transcript_24268:36-302(+)